MKLRGSVSIKDFLESFRICFAQIPVELKPKNTSLHFYVHSFKNDQIKLALVNYLFININCGVLLIYANLGWKMLFGAIKAIRIGNVKGSCIYIQ